MSKRKKVRWVEEGWDPLAGPGTQPANTVIDVDVLARPAECYNRRVWWAGSGNDLFRESVSDDDVAEVCQAMDWTPWHAFQVVTANPSRLRLLAGTDAKVQAAGDRFHIWWGVRVQAPADLPLLDELRNAAVRKRFLLAQPLQQGLGQISLGGIDWVIVGGSPDVPMAASQLNGARSIRDQCQAAQVPFTFLGRCNGMRDRSLDGVTHDYRPDWDVEPIPERIYHGYAAYSIRSARRRRVSGPVSLSATSSTDVHI